MSKKHERKGIVVELFNEQAGYCCYCAKPMTLRLSRPRTATVEHIKPRAHGGSNRPFNIAAACYPCNQKKKDTSLIMFLWANPRLAA